MKNTQDLLHGNIRRELIALTIPLVLGNILQQFYNTIDSFIVGRYVGTEAFAGIGVAGSIMNLFIFILNGGCNGMSIIFAELYGQKNYEKLRKESFLSLSAGGGFTIVLSIASLLVLYPVLGLIQTPLEVEPYVVAYLQIIFIGLPATFLYNWCSAVLRAAGDTETPLWTLFIAMCMNLALDVAFVLGLHMGTAGTALATVIAQLFFCRSVSVDHEEKTSNFFLQPEGYGNGSAASEADSQFRGGVCPSSVQYLHWKDAGPGSGKLRWNRDHFRIYGDHQN